MSAASAIRWCALDRETGSPRPKTRGGDRHSGRIEAHADLILSLVDERDDVTLAELQARLAEHDYGFGVGTLWRFVSRRGITWKKTPRTPKSRSGRKS